MVITLSCLIPRPKFPLQISGYMNSSSCRVDTNPIDCPKNSSPKEIEPRSHTNSKPVRPKPSDQRGLTFLSKKKGKFRKKNYNRPTKLFSFQMTFRLTIVVMISFRSFSLQKTFLGALDPP